jgi:Domain of Unknown Function (DUF1543)
MLKKSLFAVFLGGKLTDDRLGEDHEVVFVVAATQKEARTLAKAKWKGVAEGIHIDAIQKVEVVDGHRILLEETGESDRAKINNQYSA